MTRKRRPPTKQEIAAMNQDKDDGMLMNELVAKYNFSCKTINKYVPGLTKEDRVQEFKAIVDAAVKDYFANPEINSVQELARNYGISETSIGNAIRAEINRRAEAGEFIRKVRKPSSGNKPITPSSWGYIKDDNKRKAVERKFEGQLCKENWLDSELPAYDYAKMKPKW